MWISSFINRSLTPGLERSASSNTDFRSPMSLPTPMLRPPDPPLPADPPPEYFRWISLSTGKRKLFRQALFVWTRRCPAPECLTWLAWLVATCSSWLWLLLLLLQLATSAALFAWNDSRWLLRRCCCCSAVDGVGTDDCNGRPKEARRSST